MAIYWFWCYAAYGEGKNTIDTLLGDSGGGRKLMKTFESTALNLVGLVVVKP